MLLYILKIKETTIETIKYNLSYNAIHKINNMQI